MKEESMRLSLWIAPTVLFIAVAAALVQREHAQSQPVLETEAATSEIQADAAEAPATALAKPLIHVEPDEDVRLIHSPPSGGPDPVWRVIDLGLAGDVLSTSNIPALTISNTAPRGEELIAAKSSAAKSNTSPWEIVGYSVKNKPIHIRKYGTAGEMTLIVCGLNGDDRIAVKWIDSLSQQLADAPELLQGRQIVLLRDPNPDGLTMKTVANERGVILNQNFPTAHYRPGESSGPGPASEPETRAVLEVLYRLQPQRIIHVQSAGKSEIFWTDKARPVAESLRDGLQITAQPWDASQGAGSIEEFASQILQAEALTMRLDTGDDWRSAAIGHFPKLMAAAVPQIANETLAIAQASRSHDDSQFDGGGDVPSPFSAESNPDAATNIRRLDRRGYEELPPPPEKPSW